MTLTKLNYVNLKNGKFDSTSSADMVDMFQAMRDGPNRNNIVVHFHGGMVGENLGMEKAEAILPWYQGADAYPVFFVWEAGLLDVIRHNLREIAGERIFNKILAKVEKNLRAKLSGGDGGWSVRLEVPDEAKVKAELRRVGDGAVPYADIPTTTEATLLNRDERANFIADLEGDNDLTMMIQEIAKGLQDPVETRIDGTWGSTIRTSASTLMSPEVLGPMQRSPVVAEKGLMTIARIIKGALVVLVRVLHRFFKGTDHGPHATIVEEILREFYLANVGRIIWSAMKKDTADAFGDDSSQYGGTAFIQGLRKLDEEGRRPRVVLVGHSTGAVYICHFLKKAHEVLPADFKFDVVYLAPAVTFQLFAATLTDCGDRIRLFRSFGMKDDLEKADKLVPVLYPHSTLYFISGVVEDEVDMPLVGMQRYYSKERPYAAREEIVVVNNFLEDREIEQIWSITDDAAPEGSRTDSESHSGFDDVSEMTISETMKSVVAILRAGGSDRGA